MVSDKRKIANYWKIEIESIDVNIKNFKKQKIKYKRKGYERANIEYSIIVTNWQIGYKNKPIK